MLKDKKEDQAGEFSSSNNAPTVESLQKENAQLKAQLFHVQKLATLGMLTASVVHEFNNLLTPVINYAQLAQANEKYVEKALQTAISDGFSATDICNAILAISKPGENPPSTIKLICIVEAALKVLARKPARDLIDLQLDIPEELFVKTQPALIEHAIVNLLINARTAVLTRNENRQIKISATQSQSATTFRIFDNGCGITPDDLPRVCDPFFTAFPDETPTTGGLGLTISKAIIEHLGGEIYLQSIHGQSTTATITLPIS